MSPDRGDRFDRKAAFVTRLSPTRLQIQPSVWIAPGAVVVGDVSLGEESSVWYGCVLRGDLEPVRVGRFTNIQDLTLVHVDIDMPTTIGDSVSIGHRCVIHGCTIEDGALIGMGAVVLSGARVCQGALVAAGALIREGFEVPPGMIAAGVPAKIRGPVDESLRERILFGVDNYRLCGSEYRSGRCGRGPYDGRATEPSAEPGP